MAIDDCVNRPLLTAEVIGMALTRRINELQQWRNRIDDDLEEMYDEQSQAFQERVKSQSIPTEFGIDRGYPSYEI